jgi:hypothetical protein
VVQSGSSAEAAPGWRWAARLVAFDYAPSFSFNVDQMEFDERLSTLRAALRPPESVTQPAAVLTHALRSWESGGGDEPYVALHLRCAGRSFVSATCILSQSSQADIHASLSK